MVTNTNDSGPGSLRAVIASASPTMSSPSRLPERFRWAAPSRSIEAWRLKVREPPSQRDDG